MTGDGRLVRTKGWEGREEVEDFCPFASENKFQMSREKGTGTGKEFINQWCKGQTKKVNGLPPAGQLDSRIQS